MKQNVDMRIGRLCLPCSSLCSSLLPPLISFREKLPTHTFIFFSSSILFALFLAEISLSDTIFRCSELLYDPLMTWSIHEMDVLV